MSSLKSFLCATVISSSFLVSAAHAKDLFPEKHTHRFDSTKELSDCISSHVNGTGTLLCKPSDKLEESVTRILTPKEAESTKIKAAWLHLYPITLNERLKSSYSLGSVYFLTSNNQMAMAPFANYGFSFAELQKSLPDIVVSNSDGSSHDSNDEGSESIAKKISHILASILTSGIQIMLTVMVFGYMFSIVKKFFFNNAATRYPKDQMATFSDIAGNRKTISELREITDLIKENDRNKVDMIPNGILFEGPPGNAKTLMACAFAGELDVPFYSMTGSDVVELYAGLGALKIRRLFKQLRKHRNGAVLFIDEIDALASKRDGGFGEANSEHQQTVAALLNEMDGFQHKQKKKSGLLHGSHRVIVIGATNRKDVLDPAVMRAGRLDRIIHVPNPNLKTIKAILDLNLTGTNINFAPDADLDRIARTFIGENGARVADFVRELRLSIWRDKLDVVDQKALDNCVDDTLIGRVRDDMSTDKENELLAARHEAGHVFIAMTSEGAPEVRKITIVPREKAYGYVSFYNKDVSESNQTKASLIAQIKIAYAGRATEEVYYGEENITTGASGDIHSATMILRQMSEKLGMFGKLGNIEMSDLYGRPTFSEHGRWEAEKAMIEFGNELYGTVVETISSYKDVIDDITDALLEKKTMMADEVAEIIKKHDIRVIKHKEITS